MRPSPPTHPSSQPSPHSQQPPHSQMMTTTSFMGPRYPGPRPGGVRMTQIGNDFSGVSFPINYYVSMFVCMYTDMNCYGR